MFANPFPEGLSLNVLSRSLLTGCVALCCITLTTTTHAESDERLPATVVRALKAAGVPQASVGVFVQEVDARLPRVSVNANVPMNPASVMKLVTTYAALELLGPAYLWKTEAYANGKISAGILDGDLILKGFGDPKLTIESFWLLQRQLRARGIKEIHGDLVLDRSYFDLAEYDPARFDQEPLRPYNVGPDALLLNFKAMRFDFIPQAASHSVQVIADPHPAQVDIINLIKLTSSATASCGAWKEGIRTDVTATATGQRVVLTGNYPLACGEKSWHLSLLNHPQYVYGVFRQLWEESGGKLTGNLREGSVGGSVAGGVGGVGSSAIRVAQIDSATLSEVVRDINKFSNNVMARQLYLTLGAEATKHPAREQDGEMAIRGWLMQKGLKIPELVIENGSGLSRKERISAENLAHLLMAAYASPVMPEFIASLPLLAVDGTMHKRLLTNAIAGQAHVKTGTLEGAKAIAGYVLDKKGKTQVVVFITNHPHAAATQSAQDALLLCVYERGC